MRIARSPIIDLCSTEATRCQHQWGGGSNQQFWIDLCLQSWLLAGEWGPYIEGHGAGAGAERVPVWWGFMGK